LRIEEDTVSAEYAVLRLRGEFDTPYVPEFAERIDALIAAGKPRVVLNLRYLRLINSTALGAIVKSQKKLLQHGGDLVISHPSAFCRDVIEKVGLNRILRVVDDDAEAVGLVTDVVRPTATVQEAGDVLFSYVDATKASFAPRPTEIGRIRAFEEEAMLFDWNAASTTLSNDDVKKLLEPGTELRLKFKLPLTKKSDFMEAMSRIESTTLPRQGVGIRVRARFTKIDDAARAAIVRFVQDMRFLKNELEKAKNG
jgi:anti-anti-sigma factor